MKKLFILFALLICLTNLKAQYVTIPDANFATWLQTNIPSAMNGNQMDTTSLAVTTRISLIINNLAITDLTGIQYFDSLKILDCGNKLTGQTLNNIINIPKLPTKLKTLKCERLKLITLPILPPLFDSLLCSFNEISILPSLPNSLSVLNCSYNKLHNLPILPNNLLSLNCDKDTIYTLPVLPNCLRDLSCNYCSLTSLPSILPDSLRSLNCFDNPLNFLPNLPTKLNSLNCGNTNISSISSLPTTLKYIFVSENHNLTSLPTFPTILEHIECQNCQITTLPQLPDSLLFLYIRNNSILTLSSLPINLKILAIAGNPINCISTLPKTLSFIDIGNTNITCIPNYPPNIMPTSLNTQIYNYPLCTPGNTLTNPYGCERAHGISGNAYFDTNTNCIKDTIDLKLKNINFKLFDSNNQYLNQAGSYINGVYNFTYPSGNYNVLLDTTNVPYIEQCAYPGIDSIVLLTALNPTADNVDFSIKCKSGFDLGIQSVLTNGIVFPGQNHHLKIAAGDMSKWYNLNCASGISGQLTVNVSGPVTFVASSIGSLTPIVTGTTFTYNIADFGSVNFTNDFEIILKTNTTATAGDSICVSVNVNPINGDSNINNNTYHYCYGVVNSYDPNMKEVYPINVESGYNDWFTYTIHFQNTGNASAINIKLIDTLDSNLDLETFKVINYSHINIWSINNKVAFFNFQNIQLPDSTTDAEGSKGYIQYKIKPKSNLGAGTKIKNTAYIYFDYNSPIVTNTTINEYTQVVSVKENFKSLQSVVYPNPTNGLFIIEFSSKEKQSMQLFDIAGNSVLSQTIENGRSTIDANHLEAGIYNISIKGNTSTTNKKLVIVK